MSVKSMHYNHPYWPSPRAARFARILIAAGRAPKPAGRMTHDKALTVMADILHMSVHDFLHVKPLNILQRLGLASDEEQALEMLGSSGIDPWWIIGGSRRLPCCVACDRVLAPAPGAPVAAAAAPGALVTLRRSLMEYFAEETGSVGEAHFNAINEILEQFQGLTL